MDPASLAIMTVVSTGMQALGSIAQGRQQAASAKYNAQVQENNATIARNNAALAAAEGAANAGIEQQKTRAKVGGIKAAQAANNIDVNTGSAVDVRSSASELGELNAITIRGNAARQAYGYQTQASSDQAQAQLDRQQAKYDAQAGYLNAATSLIGGTVKGVQNGNYDAWIGKSSMNSGGDSIDYYNEGI